MAATADEMIEKWDGDSTVVKADTLDDLAAQTGLPVRCTLVREELYPALKGRLPEPFPVKILVRQPWQKELPRQGQE